MLLLPTSDELVVAALVGGVGLPTRRRVEDERRGFEL